MTLISNKNVDELERRGQEWRGEKGVQPLCRDGQSRLMAFNFAQRRFEPKLGAYAVRFNRLLAEWAAAYPQSTVWRVVQAHHLAATAWSNHPPEEILGFFQEAERLLLDAERLGGRTADWYTSAVTLSLSGHDLEVWEKTKAAGFQRPAWLKNPIGIAEEGLRSFPEHQITYFRIAGNARRLGFPGGTEAWARHVCDLLPQKGLEPYARAIWSMEPIYREKMFKKPGYGDWVTFRQGFQDLLAKGANTSRNLNSLLRFARKAEDKATARHLLEIIADKPDPEVFEIESRFLEIKTWATTDAPRIEPLWAKAARNPQSLAWSRDGKTLYIGSQDRQLGALDSTTGEVRARWDMQPESREINDIAVSPDGKLVAAVSGEETRDTPGWCRVWDSENGKVVQTFHASKGPLNALAFSMDGNELVFGGGAYSGPSEVWHWVRGEEHATLLDWAANHHHTIYAIAWAPDASSLVFNCQNSRVTVAENVRELRLVKQKATPGISNASALCYSPDGRFIAAALRLGWEDRDKANGCIALFHTEDMRPREDVLPPLTGGLMTLDYSPDGSWIAAGGYDGYIYILDSATLEIATWWNTNHGLLYKLRWSPDGKSIASAADAGKVAVWPIRFEKVQTGKNPR
ncbi:MAG: SMP-30/gluconolactonase/LRE family protein [Verrucomicrobiaceae bacterium]|nr:SMP-30/gluconolactonase/LRE family protein [Verrucomicrobiaceae bacterium]